MDRFRKNCSAYSSPAVILLVIICFLFMKDSGTTAAIAFLAVVFAISFFMRPFLPMGNIDFSHAGFGLSFGLGLFLCFYPAWFISAVGLCDYSDMIVHVTFIVMAVMGYVIKRYYLKKTYITGDEFGEFLKGFAFFAVIFLIFFWAIGFLPLVDPGTENYMDFGFIKTIYRQKSAIPEDMWFGGSTLNYYYLGQAAAVYMCRLAHTTPEYVYNMMLALIAGMVFVMVSELVTGLFTALVPGAAGSRYVKAGSVTGGMLAAFGANPHWIVYGMIIPFVKKYIGNGETDRYWFADGTVFIRPQLGDPDNGKNEFPAYSVILGDLHAHFINLIFVLPLIAILFALVTSYSGKDDGKRRAGHVYALALISALLGYYKGANYWDFAIYFVICGAVITFSDIRRLGFRPAAFAQIACKALLVITGSVVAILPFTLHFNKMESGIALCEDHSPFYKLFILWGFAVFCSILLIYCMYSRRPDNAVCDKTCRSSLLAFTLCTIGLVITPEVVYVIDIYGSVNKRFNTMFKLTYQAYVLFAVIVGILVAYLLYTAYSASVINRAVSALAGCIIFFCILSSLYTPYAVKQWFGNIFDPEYRKGISSLAGLYDDPVYGFEMEAYDVLEADPAGLVHIVEAAGNSYTHESALSVYSGACTPVGWFVHEWMWHNDADPVRARADEVNMFYTSGNENYCRDFVRKYDIDYIMVGPAEVCKYPVRREGFLALGEICTATVWQDVDLFLLKVTK